MHVRHLLVVLVVLIVALGGCVIPPSLSVENLDAGVNSPPAILAVRNDQDELPEPGPVLIERGPGTMSLTLFDTDLEDTLYVRVFVEYTVADPKPARSTCTASPSGSPQRTAACDLLALCQVSDIGVGIERLMNVAVFDRMPLEDGTRPAFKAMPAGGHTTSKTFKLTCVEPST